jgi:glycosyltransferase involved in cell wall biosynthesis
MLEDAKFPLPPPGKTGWPWTEESKPLPPLMPNGNPWPKVSIVTPSYNQGQFLEETIRSVLLQNYPNLEYIIMDGGSTDNSVEIIRKYEPWLKYWVSEKDGGQSHAINKGFTHSTGNLLGWLNSDDYYLPETLYKLCKANLSDPTVGLVYGQGHIINSKGKIVYTPTLKQVTRESLFDWSFGNDFMQPSSLFTEKAWSDCGTLDERLHYSMDVDLFLKIAIKYDFLMIEDILSISHSHCGAKTTVDREKMFVDLAIVMMRHSNEASARRILEEMINRLRYLEEKDRILWKIPMAQVVLGVFRKLGLGKRTQP